MIVLSYQNKHRLKKALTIAAIVLAAIVVYFIVRFIYLGRFVVYDENGVHFDFGTQVEAEGGSIDAPPEGDFTLKKEAATGEYAAAPQEDGYAALSGVVVTAADWGDPAAVAENLAKSDANAVLMDVKGVTGKFFYKSGLTHAETADADLDAIAAVISSLKDKSGMTLIARLPAFPDSAFALASPADALPITGGALWMDANGSYTMDPAAAAVQAYLVGTARELSDLGFDEIVFDGFTFPQSGNIVYGGDGTQAVRDAAKAVCDQLGKYDIKVSFISEDSEVTAMSYRGYIPAESGDSVAALAAQYEALLPGDEKRLVFLTASNDTRFTPFSVLAPLSEA